MKSMVTNVNRKTGLFLSAMIVFGANLVSVRSVSATDCTVFTEAPSSSSPLSITILDTDIGTEAYERLVTYSNGGHRQLGLTIAAKFNFFDNCEYVGIGIGDGSGGNGYRPNYTLWIWKDGVDLSIARAAIYELVNASSNPVVTNGDCNISCDGTYGRQFDGTFAETSTTEVPQISTTTTLPESNDAQGDSSLQEPYVNTTTTTTIAVAKNSSSASYTANKTPAVKESFRNCSEVNAIYPRGVAKSVTAAKKQKNYPVNNPYVSKSLYQKLAKMDRDKDLTVCEK
jgi:hypothetical protein